MDTVELLVSDLDGMTDFYRRAVTLDVLDQSGATATLGRGGVASIVLRQEKDLPGRDSRGAGLYHTAIVFQDQARLASALASMARHAGQLYEGSADHLVSEAFYFHDPEGNGLECFVDTPFHVAQPYGDGLDLSATDADIDGFVRAANETGSIGGGLYDDAISTAAQYSRLAPLQR